MARLITAKEVLDLTGYKSRTTLWRKVRANVFPAPVKLPGDAVRWREQEVQEWIDDAPRQTYTQS
jgi:prophage regulatory protein|tara:strand:+ start:3280 stop:3474 length:195 start_codon:yes stop_codon:yes gene_type:complete